MTKKHFIALAEAIKRHNQNDFKDEFSVMQILTLMDFCKSQNPVFNADRWLGYIAGDNGPNGGKIK